MTGHAKHLPADERRETTVEAVAKSAREVPASLDTEAAAMLFIGTIQGLVMQSLLSGDMAAALAGRAPGAGGLPRFTLDDFMLPPELPYVLPSELLRRRPDIRAAEALLQAANAEYGVAVASLYPRIGLSANLASQALSAGSLFGAGSAAWGRWRS